MKKIVENLISIIFILLILFLGLKSCIKTTIPSINSVEKYSTKLPNGEVDVTYLCPGNYLVFSKSNYGFEDNGIFKMERRSIIHYLGGFYNIDEDGTPLGFRYYTDIDYAWKVNLSLEYRTGTSSQSTFSNLVEYEEIFKYSQNSRFLEIGDTKYEKVPVSPDEVIKIKNLIRNVK